MAKRKYNISLSKLARRRSHGEIIRSLLSCFHIIINRFRRCRTGATGRWECAQLSAAPSVTVSVNEIRQKCSDSPDRLAYVKKRNPLLLPGSHKALANEALIH